jgi:signal transduction histidine kinase
VSRLPITIRLTLVFALAMAAVLAATGVFMHSRFASDLDATLDEGLRSRADDVATFVQRRGAGSIRSRPGRLTEANESVAQVVGPRGELVDGSAQVGGRPLLRPGELGRARTRTVLVERRLVPWVDEDPMRLLATPVEARGERVVVVVGTSLGDRDDALDVLAAELLIGGPLALLLATLAAWGLARAALRPVESMRCEAAVISGAEPGRRLSVPRTRDELSRLGETLNAMLDRLEDALAQERAFVTGASHELRTPLAILKAELELALRQGGSRHELQDGLRVAAEEAERLVRITEDLLVLARSERRRLPVHKEWVEVDAVFATVMGRFAPRAHELGRGLEAHAPHDLRVPVDRVRLEQALGNMVDNALRHGSGRVRLVATERAGRVELHVCDEGPGFAPDFLPRAFGRFSRADEARGSEGTGLGLAVVEGIAVAHGGHAEAANGDSRGADVWLALPVTPGRQARGRRRQPRRGSWSIAR